MKSRDIQFNKDDKSKQQKLFQLTSANESCCNVTFINFCQGKKKLFHAEMILRFLNVGMTFP